MTRKTIGIISGLAALVLLSSCSEKTLKLCGEVIRPAKEIKMYNMRLPIIDMNIRIDNEHSPDASKLDVAYHSENGAFEDLSISLKYFAGKIPILKAGDYLCFELEKEDFTETKNGKYWVNLLPANGRLVSYTQKNE